jgi:hypothetical protein
MNHDGVVIECGLLRIEFVWSADRYRHRILTSAPGGEYFLTSREGRPDEKWPPSPPLQSLHWEVRPGGVRVVMLVGMAGRSHWSMSVEADAGRGRLVFDVACRVSEQPLWLGSSYDISPPKNGLSLGLNIEPMLLAALLFENPERAAISAPAEDGPLPRTVRWSYSITLRDDWGTH